MLHLHQHAGMRRPDITPPGPAVPFERALLAAGEETGKLDDILRLLADYFEAEDRAMKRALRSAARFPLLLPIVLVFTPLFGRWYLNRPKYVLGRLLRSLTIAIEAGLGLERASTLAAEASGNEAVAEHVRRQSARSRSTQPLADTFRGCPHVPFTTIAAMQVADASGDYAGTLKKMAELHEG